jgi:MFS transporter, DHA3 family, tetracycline resistance protein
VISMGGQVDALGQIIGGPPVGYVGTVFSLRAAMVAVSAILSPVLLLLVYAARKGKGRVVVVKEVEGEEVATPELV